VLKKLKKAMGEYWKGYWIRVFDNANKFLSLLSVEQLENFLTFLEERNN